MTENPPYGETWTGPTAIQHPTSGAQPSIQPGQQFPPYGAPQYGAPQYGAPQYGAPQYGSPQYGPNQQGPHQYAQYGTSGVPAQPTGPSFLALVPLPFKLALLSAIAGVVTYFMGFVSWVSVGEDVDRKAERWADDLGGEFGIPAFLTMVFTPGYFLLFLGAAGVASFAFVAPKWRKYLPHIAGAVVLSWLGLLACALALPGFLSLGAGAIIALILGAVQLALIGAAVILDGRTESR